MIEDGNPRLPTSYSISRALRHRAVPLGLMGAGLLGLSLIAPTAPLLAQRTDAQTVQTPMGRAPLSFADIAERVKPAVVSVHVGAPARTAQARGGKGGGGAPVIPEVPEDHPLHEFFKNLPREFRGPQGPQVPGGAVPRQAQGSGFIISPDGLVVTNNHVIDGAGKLQVSFDEREKFDAELVGADPRTDIALLRIKGGTTPFPHVKFADKTPRVGDWVLAVGNPFGLGGTVTAGIVSALARDIGSGPYDYMQIDAAVNRGNSGGPTFNLDGEVVGVNTAIYSPSGGNVGIAFAVPSRTAAEVIKQLQAKGAVSRGWLGVKIENVDEDKAASLGLSEQKGALVNEITPNGPAAGSQLKAGDVIVAVNGSRIENSRDLARKIAEYAPGTQVNIDVSRFGKPEAVTVKLGTFPGNQEVAKAEPAPKPTSTEVGQLGLSLATAPAPGGPAPGGKAGAAAGAGVAITDVDANSDAAAKGLKAGDIILDVQGQPVASPADVEAGVKNVKAAGRPAVMLRVKSGEATRFVAVQLKKG
jgi:serine protease Do